MTTWTVGEGRSLPWTRAMERLAAEDDAANERLDRQLAGEYRPRPVERTHCPDGHPLDGVKLRDGKPRRYCRQCNRERMAKARAG